MPSGLYGRTDNSDTVLKQIGAGLQKLPGNAIGAPVDLANLLLNVGKAGVGYIGSETSIFKADSLPEVNDNPIGGSKWINKKFGLEDTGAVDSMVQMAGGLINPASSVTAAAKIPAFLKAIILPALALKDAGTVETASRFLNRGANPDALYRATGIFKGTEADAPLKAVLPDTSASLSLGGTIRRANYNSNTDQQFTKLSDNAQYLPDVLNHPALFEAAPYLKDVKVVARDTPGGGYIDNTIRMGPATSDEGFMSVLLHETQHAVQKKSGFSTGGNPGMFLRDQDAVRAAKTSAEINGNKTDIDSLNGLLDKAYDNYLNIGGELEAQVVQAQRKNPELLKQSPASLAIKQAQGAENIIDTKKIADRPKLDDDPAIQAILDFYTPP